MSVGISNGVKNAMLNQIRDLMDGGSGPALIRLYSGTQPAAGGAPSGSNVKLAEISFNDPSAPNAATGELMFDVTGMTTTGLANGDATWARIISGSDFHVVDLKVGASGSGEPVELSSISISVGSTVEILSAKVVFNN